MTRATVTRNRKNRLHALTAIVTGLKTLSASEEAHLILGARPLHFAIGVRDCCDEVDCRLSEVFGDIVKLSSKDGVRSD